MRPYRGRTDAAIRTSVGPGQITAGQLAQGETDQGERRYPRKTNISKSVNPASPKMIFSTNIPEQKEKAIERFQWLLSNGKRIELKEKKAKRSISQNAYLHLVMSWFGLEFGYTLEEVKQEIFKKAVNPEIFYEGEKDGIVKIERWRSTADLNTGEMTTAIDRFRDFSAKHGCYLPEPKDLSYLEEIENELSKHTSKQYL